MIPKRIIENFSIFSIEHVEVPLELSNHPFENDTAMYVDPRGVTGTTHASFDFPKALSHPHHTASWCSSDENTSAISCPTKTSKFLAPGHRTTTFAESNMCRTNLHGETPGNSTTLKYLFPSSVRKTPTSLPRTNSKRPSSCLFLSSIFAITSSAWLNTPITMLIKTIPPTILAIVHDFTTFIPPRISLQGGIFESFWYSV